MSFAVVKFLNANIAAVVPCSWLFEDKCFWPPNDINSKILPMIENGISPSETWDMFTIQNLGIHETYSDAWLKLLIGKEQLNFDMPYPEGFSSEKRKKRKRKSSSSSSSEEEDTCLPSSFGHSLPDFKKKDKRPFVETISIERETASSSNITEESPGSLVLVDSTQNGKENDPDYKIEVSSCDETEELSSPLVIASSQNRKKNDSDYKIKDYLKTIVAELKYLKYKQQMLEHKLDKVLRGVKKQPKDKCSKTTESLSPEIIKLLPLSDMGSLQIVELELAEQETAEKMVNYLQRVGGGTCRQTVNHFLRKMLADQLACNFSLKGQRGKLPFKELNIYKVIIDAVRSRDDLKDVLETEIIKCISNWLRHAKAR